MVFNLKERKYEITNLYVSKTYAGLMLGKRDFDMNFSLYVGYNYPTIWGKRKSFKVPPSLEQLTSGLPPYCFHSWVISEPIQSGADGSELVISWYENTMVLDIQQYLLNLLSDIDWAEEAVDFEF